MGPRDLIGWIGARMEGRRGYAASLSRETVAERLQYFATPTEDRWSDGNVDRCGRKGSLRKISREGLSRKHAHARAISRRRMRDSSCSRVKFTRMGPKPNR